MNVPSQQTIVVNIRKLDAEKIKKAKKLTAEAWRNVASDGERLLQSPIQNQITEFDEWE